MMLKKILTIGLTVCAFTGNADNSYEIPDIIPSPAPTPHPLPNPNPGFIAQKEQRPYPQGLEAQADYFESGGQGQQITSIPSEGLFEVRTEGQKKVFYRLIPIE